MGNCCSRKKAIPSPRASVIDEVVSAREIHQISLKVSMKKRRTLARALNVCREKIQEIEESCSLKQLDEADVIYEILEEWKKVKGKEATKKVLKKALIEVGLQNILQEVFTESENAESAETSFVGKITAQSDVRQEASFSNVNASIEIAETTETRSQQIEVETIAYSSSINALTEMNVTSEEIFKISLMISRNQHRQLARKLKITEQKVQEFESNCMIRHFGDDEIVIQILYEWQRNNGENATKNILNQALKSIGRKDIADLVFSKLPPNSENEASKKQYKEIQLLIEDKQVKVYQHVELPQVNWTDRVLPLEELYVQLELMKTDDDYEGVMGQEIQLEELFNHIDEEAPMKILIEGGPGYGKTTLCYKLLNDWGRNRHYIRTKFKMVFLFEMRCYKENVSIEEMLKGECESAGVNGDDASNCIEAFENEILLILDGFDELNDEGQRKILMQIQKNQYPSMTILVTSRRGVIRTGEKKGIREGGALKKALENLKVENLWNKRVLIKGVTTDKIQTFMKKYFDKDIEDLELKIESIITEEMKQVLECPLFLILLAMMLEEKKLENLTSKIMLYKEFFNFMIRRNLIRENKISDDEQVNLFDEFSKWIQYLDQFGRLAVEYLCENKLMFEEKEVLKCCNDKIIFKLGFLIKIPKIQGRRRENLYQPIHKSFLEFVAAFAMWNLFKRDETQFYKEIERIGNKGLKPTNDSLFYVFLGGLMNSKASVLFQSFTRYALWFNIEHLCFRNILLEIQDIDCFFSSFQPMLDSFIPWFYSNKWNRWLIDEYFQSAIHSRILKDSNDRCLIKVFRWESEFPLNLSHDLHVETLYFNLCKEYYIGNSNKISCKCKTIICEFSQFFNVDNLNHILSFIDTIQSEKIQLYFSSQWNENNSHVLNLLHKELFEGQWIEKNIDRLKFELTEFDDPHCISFLVDLVKKNKIIEGIHLWISKPKRRTEEENDFLKKETEKLFNAIIQSKTIKEFIFQNVDYNFSPQLNFNEIINSQLTSIYLLGSMNVFISNEKKREQFLFEEVRFDLSDDELALNFIHNIKEIKFLDCKLICFNSLIETEWPGLKGIEELKLVIPANIEQLQLLNSVSLLTSLQVLILDFSLLITILPGCKDSFINFFTPLHLRICQLIYFQNLESFSFFTEVLMEVLINKEIDENNSKVDSNIGKKVQLQELVIQFNKHVVFSELKESKGIEWIQFMLRNRYLQQCCWIDYLNNITSDQLECLFPSSDKFRISEVNGMDANSSRWYQFEYRWFLSCDIFCIKFFDE